MPTRLWVALALCLVAGSVTDSRAAALIITDHNSTVGVDPLSPFGLFSWSVDGIDHGFEQWFWFRSGEDAFESSLDTLPLVHQNAAANQILLGYQGPAFAAELVYTLVGGTTGSGLSEIREVARLTNIGKQPLSLSWFLEVDLDLGGTGQDDVAEGGASNVAQRDAHTVATVKPSPTANAFQIAAFPMIFQSLSDDQITDFDNTGSPFGPADVTFGFQWNLVIPPGESATLVTTKSIVPTPEPNTLGLLTIGFICLKCCQRRRPNRG